MRVFNMSSDQPSEIERYASSDSRLRTPERLLSWCARIIPLCMLLQIAISHTLWLPIGRSFPEVEAIGGLPVELGIAGDAIVLAILAGSLLWLMVRPFNRTATAVMAAASILFVIEDIARLQPWLYLFELMLIIMAVVDPRRRGGETRALIILLLASLYVWSGVQKLNAAFSTEIMPWLVSPAGLGELIRAHPFLAYAAPALELFVGIALAAWRLRRTAVLAGAFVHLALVLLLGPLGHNWNVVVWPWNIAMALILVLLVWPFADDATRAERIPLQELRSSPLFYAVAVLGWILPALNYAGLWDSHLSGSLYSGNNSEAIFYVQEGGRERLPPHPRDVVYFYPSSGEEFIMLDHWALIDLDAPFYPERRYFLTLGRKLCDCLSDTAGAGIRVTTKAKFTSRQSLETIPCGRLTRSPGAPARHQ